MKRVLSAILCLAIVWSGAAFTAGAAEIPKPQIGFATVRYQIDGQTYSYSVRAGKAVELRAEYAMQQYGDQILVGWKTDDDTSYYYDNTDFWRSDGRTDLVPQSGDAVTFTPIWCPIAIRKEEVFSFTNSESVFNADVDGYLFTRQHFLRILPNWFCTFALSPFAPLAAVICAFYLFIWPTFPFYGSCCGFPIAVLQQHYGKLDLLSGQGVSSVCELQPDDDIQSIINYYNIHAVAAQPAEHLALVPGTQEYTEQLHALYDTLCSGTPVYFELYGDGPHLLRRALTDPASIVTEFDDLTAHGVLLTGAYTDGSGNHVLITYDNNSTKYVNGSCNIIYIDPDFTKICSSYAWNDDDALNGFTWNDDLGVYDAFKPEGISNPFAWHKRFLKNLPSLLRQIVLVYKAR